MGINALLFFYAFFVVLTLMLTVAMYKNE